MAMEIIVRVVIGILCVTAFLWLPLTYKER